MSGAPTHPVIEMDGVTVSFDGLAVLDGLTFSMEQGELRFLIGPNGAGKTTMLDVITGRTRPRSGRVRYTGTVDVTIDAASVKTFDTRLDAIVKGERFLNVEKFPTLTFKSSSLKFDGDKVTGVDGDLTMLGVTKPVTLAVSNFSCADNPFNKKPMCGGNATGTIKRSDWGMAQGVQTQTPGDVLTLRIPIEAYKE